MRFRAFKYLFPLLVYIGCYRAFTVNGWEIYIPLFFAWVLVPGMELFIRPNPSNLSREEEEQIRQPILDKYELEGSPYYSTARLWDDGILDPGQTRNALALALSASFNAPVPQPKFGVFRM